MSASLRVWFDRVVAAHRRLKAEHRLDRAARLRLAADLLTIRSLRHA